MLDINKFSVNFKENIIFTDYFIYSYIRGIIKGRFKRTEQNQFNSQDFDHYIRTLELGEHLNKTRNVLGSYLKTNDLDTVVLSKELIPKIIHGIENQKKIANSLRDIFNQKVIDHINTLKQTQERYEFIDDETIIKELKKDELNTYEISKILEIKNRYNQRLKEENILDDNDVAITILNMETDETNKYDGIIIDEVQDLTEIQIMAISRLAKIGSENISLFGDPNQTINPTVYHYGRFNSFLWKKTNPINLRNLKKNAS